jgi:hypothetical protein
MSFALGRQAPPGVAVREGSLAAPAKHAARSGRRNAVKAQAAMASSSVMGQRVGGTALKAKAAGSQRPGRVGRGLAVAPKAMFERFTEKVGMLRGSSPQGPARLSWGSGCAWPRIMMRWFLLGVHAA